MDGMFDHNHDGRLSAGERMERDYFITEMMNRSTSGDSGAGSYRPAKAGEGHIGMRLLGLLALMIGVSAFIYFPGFALIMLALAVVLFIC